MLSNDSGHLLTHAESILNPEIFSHPVWIRFGRKETAVSHKTINELLSIAKILQDDDPDNACQVLLICVAYQNQIGQSDNALRTLKKVQSLADHNTLDRMIVWAKWGMSSISFQEGKYEQTIRHLEELRTILNQKNEWILANYIDVIKVSLHSPQGSVIKKNNKSQKDPPSKDLLTVTFDWMDHWGLPGQKAEFGLFFECRKDHGTDTRGKADQFSLSTRHWQGYWHNLLMALRNTAKGYLADRNEKTQTKTSLSSSIKEQTFVNEAIPKLESEHRGGQISKYTASSNSVIVQMLGSFHIAIQDLSIKLPASRGLSLLKYMLFHHKQAIRRDVLMEVFWPNSDPDAARNNLNVAMHTLRQALRSVTENRIVCFEDGAYYLAPELELWIDVEEFDHCVKEGQRLETRNQLTAAVAEFEIAINLYQGEFLADTPYESWTVLDRERLRIAYLDTLDHLSQIYFNEERYAACVTQCQLILSRDLCREDAHCRLMQCYSRLGQGPLALRQYQICVEALQSELEVEPAPETTQLYEQIHKHERI